MQVRANSILYLNYNASPGRNNTCLSSFDDKRPNYALSNFAKADRSCPYKNKKGDPVFQFCDPDVGMVYFPTSEHYLHFQQLSQSGKEEMLRRGWADASASEILRGKQQPGSPWEINAKVLHDSLKTNGAYDDEKWTKKAIEVQMQINANKYQQSKPFRDCIDLAMELGDSFQDGLGAATIIEDTASKQFGKPEVKWGTGPKGDGTNLLGISQTAFATLLMQDQALKNKLLKEKDAINLTDITRRANGKFAQAKNNYMCHGGMCENLKAIRSDCLNDIKQPDTSELDYVYVFYDVRSIKNHNKPKEPEQRKEIHIDIDEMRKIIKVHFAGNKDLELQYNYDGTFKQAMYRDAKTNRFVVSGDLNKSWIVELKGLYQAHLANPKIQSNIPRKK